MRIAKFQAFHGIVANGPFILSALGDAPILAARCFSGAGAPGPSTLVAGDGMFCGATSGFIISGTISSPGVDYLPGDVLTLATGAATTALQITVDSVNYAGGIADWHVSAIGNYSTYPDATAALTGGSGSGASFLPALQPPDQYIDQSDPDNPILYVCKTAGNATTSVWKKISGGGGTGGFADDYDNSKSYPGGSIVRVLSAITVGGVTAVPGIYGVPPSVTVPSGGTGNQVPQYPEPTSGTVYWKLLSLPVQVTNVCSGSGNVTVYVNASSPLS